MECETNSIGAIKPQKMNSKQGGFKEGKGRGGDTNRLNHSKSSLDDASKLVDLGVNTSEVRMRKQKSRLPKNASRQNFLASRFRENLNGYSSRDSMDASVAISEATQNQEWNEEETMGDRRPSMLSMVTWRDGKSNDAPKSNER